MPTKSASGQSLNVGGTILDVTEAWDGFTGSATTAGAGAHAESRGYAGTASLIQPVQIMGTVNGIPVIAQEAASGRILITYNSGAARVTSNGGTGNGAVRIPAGQRFRDANSIPITMLRPLRRYTLTLPVRCSAAGTATAEFGLSTDNGGLTFLGTNPAFVWSCAAGANWQARYRRVAAGAIVNGVTSGISPVSGWALLGIRYTEAIDPTIEWLINGATIGRISGDALMPTYVSPSQQLYPFFGVGTPAGSTYIRSMARFVVEEI